MRGGFLTLVDVLLDYRLFGLVPVASSKL